jgi:peptidoglycan/xylan/chitin deacetylase (PgdA/CDA1 family)
VTHLRPIEALGTARHAARAIRRRSLHVVKRLGGYRAVGNSRWRRQRLLILCYHGVSIEDEHLWNGALYIHRDQLENRLQALRAFGCHVLPLAEALERLHRDDLPPRSVVLTFDDGYYDFLSRAFPLLADYQMPATVYLPTLRMEHNTPVFRLACSYVLWKSGARVATVPELRAEPFDLRTARGRSEVLEWIERHVVRERFHITDKDSFAERLASRLGVDYAALRARGQFRIVAAEEVSRLSARGVDFQLHTHTHRTRREPDTFRWEIDVNRTRIEKLTGKRPAHFCYPSGLYNERALPWLRDMGVVSATTCDPGLASRKSHPLLLPRLIDTSTLSDVEFEGWVTGAATWAVMSRRTRAS